MSTATEQPRTSWQGAAMSVEEFLALPDNGTHRELIQGRVRELGMTTRNRFHSRLVIRIGQLLANWMDRQPEPRGEVVGGEAGFWLTGTKESLVGIDVAVVSAELVAATDPKQKLYHGPPILAVEILSPIDTHEDTALMVSSYLEAGSVVWVVDPDLCTVTVYQPDGESAMFNRKDELSADPYLPGFRVGVVEIFK